jgi:hypothetical protein
METADIFAPRTDSGGREKQGGGVLSKALNFQRARYLPLCNSPETPGKTVRRLAARRAEWYHPRFA